MGPRPRSPRKATDVGGDQIQGRSSSRRWPGRSAGSCVQGRGRTEGRARGRRRRRRGAQEGLGGTGHRRFSCPRPRLRPSEVAGL